MNKRVFTILVALLLTAATLFGFSSCGGSSSGGRGTTTAIPTVRVTFPEGLTVADIAQLLEENGVCSAADFIDAVNSVGAENEFVAEITNISDRPFALEGYVFPDTYDFYVGESAQNVLGRFLRNMSSKFSDGDYERAAEAGYTMDEIVIIASIIQTEAGDPAEMKTVSSVLHNRLSSDGYINRLQCDATYFYIRDHVMPYLGGEGTTGESTTYDEEQYERISALYNTYNFGGLPAGPICNPGASALNAALYPDATDYYYFVTDTQGNYYYSETYEQHAKKCAELGITTA